MILGCLVVSVVVDCLVSLDALLVIIEYIFKYWYYLSDRPKPAALATPFKALCSSF
jgi:hypothetical protein